MATFNCPQCETRNELDSLNTSSPFAAIFPIFKCPQCAYHGAPLLSRRVVTLLAFVTLIDLIVGLWVLAASVALETNYLTYKVATTVGLIFLVAPYILAKDFLTRMRFGINRRKQM